MGFRITTWNVNGIRNPFNYQPWREKRTFQAMFDTLEADIVVMQETKIQRKDLQDDMILVPGWDVYLSLPRHKKGYSGVAIYTRNKTCAPIRAEEGITGLLTAPRSSVKFRELPEDQQIGGYPRPDQLCGDIDELELDSEGRCVLLEFPAFVLIGVYSPANRDESRHDFRISFLQALDARVRNLVAAGKHVVLTGDLNVIRSAMDSTNVTEALRKEGMTEEEWMAQPSRRILNQLLFHHEASRPPTATDEAPPTINNTPPIDDAPPPPPILWDLCRCFHPTREGMNTCWDTKRNTRPANNGSRIDYILCSDALKDYFVDADIQPGLMGSDHCPVFAVMADTVSVIGATTALAELVNPGDMFHEGARVREWTPKDCLLLSARLIPEFDRRQNIGDMFKKTASRATSQTPKRPASPCPQQPLPPASKRSRPGSDSSSSKPSTSTANKPNKPKTKASAGQKTLQAFLVKPAAPVPDSAAESRRDTPTNDSLSSCGPDALPHSASHDNDAAAAASPDGLVDPIQAKESWSKLLGKRVAPRCQHHEPCISLVTKKPGINCGRSFYICARPLGPSGDKEKDTEWRCGTFIWSSDWNKAAS